MLFLKGKGWKIKQFLVPTIPVLNLSSFVCISNSQHLKVLCVTVTEMKYVARTSINISAK